MTHDELVERAVRWLGGTRQCAVVLRECGAACGNEIPDAIGWTSRGGSILVECKTCVSDCYADRHKPSERSGARCGAFRYVLTDCPEITADLLASGWGLLRLSGDRVRRERESELFVRSESAEIMLLVSELRRCVRIYPSKRGVGLVDPEAPVVPILEDECPA
jgi:hypothetical protein